MQIFAKPFTETDPIKAFQPLSAEPFSLLFDSADRDHKDANFSYIACNPIETFTFTFTIGDQGNPFDLLQQKITALNFSKNTLPDLPPFQGGAAGLFGYDLGRTLEKIPQLAKNGSNIPDMAIGIYDQIIAFDHVQNKAWIITHARNETEAETKRAALLKQINTPKPKNSAPLSPINFTPETPKNDFINTIKTIQNYIRSGDIFQANIAQRFTAKTPENFNPFRHYKTLRAKNPAPFAAYINTGNGIIASSSPERFLSCDTRGNVSTKPIKGTAKRSATPAQNTANINALQNSQKDRAENIMITDLLRNDLSKCCDPSSINVPKLCEIESFARVHHLVSTITGKLRADQTPIDLLKACFPGGSITGAPKIRAMEIIEELENHRRSAYCGSIAIIGFNGHMDSNILIRTLIYENNTLTFSTGGGITALSDPAAEYEETLDKARAIFDSFNTDTKDQNNAA